MGNRAAGRIIVGVSTSLSGLAALRFAVAEARRRDAAQVIAVRCWPDRGAAGASQMWIEEIALSGVAEIGAAISSAFVVPPRDVTIVAQTPAGHPGSALVGLADEDADLIVLGSRHGFRVGSGIVGYCLRHAPCPVIVVPPPSMVGRGGARRLVRTMHREVRQAANSAASPPS
jgi:nucleotide-binding universal stress UspA family protein